MTQTRIPSYRLHKATGQAVVVLRGRSTYLGKHGTPESRARYDRAIARYLADRADPDHPAPVSASPPGPHSLGRQYMSVDELVLRYWQHAKTYYTKHGLPTGELYPLKQALRRARQRHPRWRGRRGGGSYMPRPHCTQTWLASQRVAWRAPGEFVTPTSRR